MIDALLEKYIEETIIPQYRNFDAAHQELHVRYVIEQSLLLARHYDVCQAMVYVVAAYHDMGLSVDRKTHHLVSAQMMRVDANLLRWFTAEQVELMAQAVEDHRASNNYEPRSLYGKIVAEADRQIDTEVIIRRTIQYGIAHYPSLNVEGHWERTWEHLQQKYARGGYMKLWIPESSNAEKLRELQALLDDKGAVRSLFNRLWEECVKR